MDTRTIICPICGWDLVLDVPTATWLHGQKGVGCDLRITEEHMARSMVLQEIRNRYKGRSAQHEQGDVTMSASDGQIAYLEERLRLAYEKKAAEEKAKKAFSASDDPWEEETVLLFKRKFENSSFEYTYCALKVGGKWFVTGRSQNGYRISYWDLVWKFLVPAYEETGEIWAVSEWLQIEV